MTQPDPVTPSNERERVWTIYEIREARALLTTYEEALRKIDALGNSTRWTHAVARTKMKARARSVLPAQTNDQT